MAMAGAEERGKERGLWVSKNEKGKDGTKGQWLRESLFPIQQAWNDSVFTFLRILFLCISSLADRFLFAEAQTVGKQENKKYFEIYVQR